MFWIRCGRVDIVISRWTEFSGDGLCYAELGQVVGRRRRRRELFSKKSGENFVSCAERLGVS